MKKIWKNFGSILSMLYVIYYL